MAPSLAWRGALGRSLALVFAVCALQPSDALRSLASTRAEERTHRRGTLSRQQLDRSSKTLGGGRDVWMLDGPPEALLASRGKAPEAALLQQSAGTARRSPFSNDGDEDGEELGLTTAAPVSEETLESPLVTIVQMILPAMQMALEGAGVDDDDVARFGQELDPVQLQEDGPGAFAPALGRAVKAIPPEALKKAAPALATTIFGALQAIGPDKLQTAAPELLSSMGTILQNLNLNPDKLTGMGDAVVGMLLGNGPSSKAGNAPKVDDVDAQVQALSAFGKLSAQIPETGKAAALQLNYSVPSISGPLDAAKRLEVFFATGASAVDDYKNSVGQLQKMLFESSGGLKAYMPRYAWTDQWKQTLDYLAKYYKSAQETVANTTRDYPPEALSAQLCPYLGTFLPTLRNVSLAYVAQLGMVVNEANKNDTVATAEPVKTGLTMIASAMSAIVVEGIFLEDDGLTEQVCRSTVFAANAKLGCKLHLPWVVAGADDDIKLSEEDEKKLDQVVHDLKKAARQGPFMAGQHMTWVWIVLIACGVMMCAGILMCLSLPLELLLLPVWLVAQVVKGALTVAIGIIALAVQIVACPIMPLVRCCCGTRKTQEDAMAGMKEAQTTGIPEEVLSKMPEHERMLAQGTDVAKVGREAGLEGVLNTMQQPFSGGPPVSAAKAGNAEDAPEAASARDQSGGQEHPMYAKLGLNPVAQLKKHYERKK